ncbi:MAG: hypothetical protein ABI878_15295 [Acidobacteriota bacterium]
MRYARNKLGLGLTVIVTMIFVVALCFVESDPNSVVASPPAVTHLTEPSDNTKINVIKALLNELKPQDAVVGGRNLVFVEIEENLFNELPKVVNGLKIERLIRTSSKAKQEVSYLTFSHWSEQNGIVGVSGIAYFSDGNMGGCNYTFENANGNWTRKGSDCFAAAS